VDASRYSCARPTQTQSRSGQITGDRLGVAVRAFTALAAIGAHNGKEPAQSL
jgi:hypothetical protein